jgi:hypothetical protein
LVDAGEVEALEIKGFAEPVEQMLPLGILGIGSGVDLVSIA